MVCITANKRGPGAQKTISQLKSTTPPLLRTESVNFLQKDRWEIFSILQVVQCLYNYTALL